MSIDLINGDCRDMLGYIVSEYGDRLCVVSDPPFNIGYHYDGYDDNLSEEDYYDLMCTIFGNTPAVVIHYPEALYQLSARMGKLPTRVCSWVYNSNTPRQHRDIAFFGVEPDFTQVIQPYKNPNDKRIKARIEKGILGGKLYDWFEVNQVKNVSKEKTAHPCQMPLKVMENIVGVLPEGMVICDPFMGSGTTGLACKNLGYDFIGIELNKDYYEIARTRLLG